MVVALIAVASAVAVLALRDPASTQLDQEAVRLAALLEGARAEARASGLEVYWQAETTTEGEERTNGFRFVGLPAGEARPTRWLNDAVAAEVAGARKVVQLGPEPVIGPQRIVLRLQERRIVLVTDGLSPFTVTSE